MIASREYVLSKLNEYTLFPKKKYGQNFLTDSRTVLKIVDALEVKDGDIIYEIGPGLGALSELLAAKNQPLYLYDIDENMVDHLKNVFKMFPHIEVIKENFLKVQDNNKVTKIIGNLPYYITTSLIEHVLINFDISDFVFMVQAEVEERLIAKRKTKEYGPLSIFIEQFFEIEKVCKVSKMAFYPVPHVDSAVFKIKFKPTEENKKKYYLFLKEIFSQRRKTISNNLGGMFKSKEEGMKILSSINIPFNKRPEELTLEEIYSLYKAITISK